MNQQLVKEKNGGIIPKIVLYMRVKIFELHQFLTQLVILYIACYLQESPKYIDLSLSIYQNSAFDITMTYRYDSEIYIGYGKFIDKTTKKMIQPNEFLEYYEKNHAVTNLSRYKIPELSQRKKGSNLTYKQHKICTVVSFR